MSPLIIDVSKKRETNGMVKYYVLLTRPRMGLDELIQQLVDTMLELSKSLELCDCHKYTE